MVVAGLRGIDHDQRSIVQQQPLSIGPDSNDRMIRMTFAVADDEQAQVISDDPGRSQSDVFYDRVILAIARSGAQRGKGCRPEIFNLVLGPITHGPDAQIHRAVDLAQTGQHLGAAGQAR